MANTRNRFKGELTITQVQEEAPVARTGMDLTFFVDTVRKSWQKVQDKAPNPAFGMVVPAEGATLAETRFRQAAQQLGLGVSVQTYEAGSAKGREKGLQAGQTWLSVQARERKAAPNSNGKSKPATSGASGLPPVANKSGKR